MIDKSLRQYYENGKPEHSRNHSQHLYNNYQESHNLGISKGK